MCMAQWADHGGVHLPPRGGEGEVLEAHAELSSSAPCPVVLGPTGEIVSPGGVLLDGVVPRSQPLVIHASLIIFLLPPLSQMASSVVNASDGDAERV